MAKNHERVLDNHSKPLPGNKNKSVYLTETLYSLGASIAHMWCEDSTCVLGEGWLVPRIGRYIAFCS